MPPADAAWLHMEQPTNPMVVNAVVWFDEPLDWELLKLVWARRVLERFPRFTQRVSDRLGRPAFEDDANFDLLQHFHRIALPAPGDDTVLRELVSDMITSPLDRTRPLWHIYLIEGYGGGCAILMRAHHCIADGVALARLLLSLTDATADAGFEPASADRSDRRHLPFDAVLSPAADAFAAARKLPGAVAHEGVESLIHPKHLKERAEGAMQDAGTLAKLLLAPPDARTLLKRPLHGSRRVAWSKPFPLERVKAAGKRAQATVNDVLVAAVVGGLRGYLQERERLPEEIHVMVPVNLRPLDEPLSRDLGNDFGLVLLSLPIGIEDRATRLREVKLQMDAIKHSHQAAISFGILSAEGMTPSQVEAALNSLFTDKASAVVTNVPGPRDSVCLTGAVVRGVLVWAPCSGSLGMTVSIFSYAGEVTVGFMTDIGLVADPQPLVDAFDHELHALCRGTRRRRAAAHR